MDEARIILGVGLAVLSLFLGRGRFPTVPKPLAIAGFVVGLGLIGWWFYPTLSWQYAAAGIAGAALLTATLTATLAATMRGRSHSYYSDSPSSPPAIDFDRPIPDQSEEAEDGA